MVVYSVVVLLVVRELVAAITGDRLVFSGIFLKGEKLWATVFHEAETEVHLRELCLPFWWGCTLVLLACPQVTSLGTASLPP